MEKLNEEIEAYRENDSHCHSPIWIWFAKSNPEVSICLLCKQELRAKNSSSSLNTHLKRKHNDEIGYNAWKICEELLELKELRLSSKRSIIQYTFSSTLLSVIHVMFFYTNLF